MTVVKFTHSFFDYKLHIEQHLTVLRYGWIEAACNVAQCVIPEMAAHVCFLDRSSVHCSYDKLYTSTCDISCYYNPSPLYGGPQSVHIQFSFSFCECGAYPFDCVNVVAECCAAIWVQPTSHFRYRRKVWCIVQSTNVQYITINGFYISGVMLAAWWFS